MTYARAWSWPSSPRCSTCRPTQRAVLVALLTEDATWSMPPAPSWYRGHAAIAAFLTDGGNIQIVRDVQIVRELGRSGRSGTIRTDTTVGLPGALSDKGRTTG